MRANPLQRGYGPADARGPTMLDVARGVARRIVGVLRLWRRRRRERRDLAEFARLDNRMLADIGLTRQSAEFLINKPFWRA